jgi:hypothetical protein
MFIDALPALALALACVISVDGFAGENLPKATDNRSWWRAECSGAGTSRLPV